MPTKVEKDSLSGVDTTGHEWDGIQELNNPLPKWWLYVFYVCVAFSSAIPRLSSRASMATPRS